MNFGDEIDQVGSSTSSLVESRAVAHGKEFGMTLIAWEHFAKKTREQQTIAPWLHALELV